MCVFVKTGESFSKPTADLGFEKNPRDKPGLDEAHIRLRPNGRQLAIDAGWTDDPDDLDIHPDHEGEGEPTTATTPDREAGDITGFSADARRRLRDRLHSMRRDADGLFVTLTYHEHLPFPSEVKDDLDAFGKWVRRHFAGVSLVWKLEPQPGRGWPHFHCIITGVDFIPVQKLASAWHGITGEGSPQHSESGVDLIPMVNEDGKLQGYLAGYMEEEYDRWPEIECGPENAEAARRWREYTGRWWGVIGRDNFPWAEWEEAAVYLAQSEAEYLIRELLDEWDVDIPSGVIPPSLTINTRGDPHDRLDDLMARL